MGHGHTHTHTEKNIPTVGCEWSRVVSQMGFQSKEGEAEWSYCRIGQRKLTANARQSVCVCSHHMPSAYTVQCLYVKF